VDVGSGVCDVRLGQTASVIVFFHIYVFLGCWA
jgi:hypothetical protein